MARRPSPHTDKKAAETALNDRLEAESLTAAVQAAAARLKAIMGPNRTKQICTLTAADMELVVGDALAAWIAKRAAQADSLRKMGAPLPLSLATLAVDPELNDPVDDIGRGPDFLLS